MISRLTLLRWIAQSFSVTGSLWSQNGGYFSNFPLSKPTTRIMASPSVNSPWKYLLGWRVDSVDTTPETVTWSSAILTLLGDRGSFLLVFAGGESGWNCKDRLAMAKKGWPNRDPSYSLEMYRENRRSMQLQFDVPRLSPSNPRVALVESRFWLGCVTITTGRGLIKTMHNLGANLWHLHIQFGDGIVTHQCVGSLLVLMPSY